jgi:hypothetical protein
MKFGKSTLLALAIPFAFASQAPAQSMAQMIMVGPQTAGNTVTVSSVTIEKDGFLVVHAIKDGKPVVPGSLGNVAVKAGTTKNVVVELSEAVASGDVVLTMLHMDDGMMGMYMFPSQDGPVMMGGKPVVATAKVN